MWYLDDWHDYVRVIAFFVNIYSVYVLVNRYCKRHHDWNIKTIDLWYSLTAWSVAGAVMSMQSVILDRPFSPGFVIIVAAALVTGKGVHRRGAWGGEA